MSLTDEELDSYLTEWTDGSEPPGSFDGIGRRAVLEVRSLRAALALAKSEAEAARELMARALDERASLTAELWEGVRVHGLTAPPANKAREGERLIHAYCGGIARREETIERVTAERDSLRTQLAEVTAQRDEARAKRLADVALLDEALRYGEELRVEVERLRADRVVTRERFKRLVDGQPGWFGFTLRAILADLGIKVEE